MAYSYKLVADGNSLSTSAPVPAGAGNWTTQIGPKLWVPAWGTVVVEAVSGQTTAQMAADQATTFAHFDAAKTRTYLTAWETTNSLFFSTAEATAKSQMQTFCSDAKAAGFTVLLFTVLPRGGVSPPPGTFETARTNINTAWRTDFSVATYDSRIRRPGAGITYADLLVDVAAETRFAVTTDTTYYYDGVHLTSLGYGIVADLVRGALAVLTRFGGGTRLAYAGRQGTRRRVAA